MGRLTLNILLSFAQFEREIVSERTRDKIAAARRKGKWSGGRPILGYDTVPQGGRVAVNEEEAGRVREIFEMYLHYKSLIPAVRELNRRGWRTKAWTSRKGKPLGGKAYSKDHLYRMLTNVAYLGKVRYKDEVHEGEHPAIVSDELFQRVQDALRHNGRTGGKMVRNKYGALLKGLLHCAACGCGMMHTYTSRGKRRYRYYVCMEANKKGWDTCPTKSLPAGEIEQFVVDRIRAVGSDPSVLAETLAETRRQATAGLAKLEAERKTLQRQLQRHNAEVRKLLDEAGLDGQRETPTSARLADLQERICQTEQRATEVREQIVAMSGRVVEERELATAMKMFDPVWDSLSTAERARVVQLLVEQVTYDGRDGTLSITFRPNGIKALVEEAQAAEAGLEA
jgi:site-specific DNA recombinase